MIRSKFYRFWARREREQLGGDKKQTNKQANKTHTKKQLFSFLLFNFYFKCLLILSASFILPLPASLLLTQSGVLSFPQVWGFPLAAGLPTLFNWQSPLPIYPILLPLGPTHLILALSCSSSLVTANYTSNKCKQCSLLLV